MTTNWLFWLNKDKIPLARALRQAAQHYRRTRGEVPTVAEVNAAEVGQLRVAGGMVIKAAKTPLYNYRIGTPEPE